MSTVRLFQKNEQFKTVEDHVKAVVKNFQSQGNPDFVETRKPSIFLPDGKEAIIYFFEGTQLGNYQAAAYFEETDSINYLVFNARTKRMFDINFPAFKKIILTYKNNFVDKDKELDDESFDKLFAKTKQCAESPEGGKYEKQVTEFLGADVTTYIDGCIRHLSEKDIKDFDVICKVEPDGTISETYIRPSYALSVCFRGVIATRKLPEHNLGDYYLLLEIDLREGGGF